jgi:ankyrin repeat protein
MRRPHYSEPAPGSGGMNHLHYAAYDGDLEGVQASLARGIPVNGRDESNWTALHWAVDMGCTGGPRERMIQVLSDAGADLEARDFEGRTPLHIACRSTSGHLATLLIDAGADIEARDQKGKTPLMNAAHNGDFGGGDLSAGTGRQSRCSRQRSQNGAGCGQH